MSNTHKLRTAQSEPDKEVISALEKALELAEEGKLRTVVIVGTLDKNNSYTAFCTHDVPSEVGHLELVKLRLLDIQNQTPPNKE